MALKQVLRINMRWLTVACLMAAWFPAHAMGWSVSPSKDPVAGTRPVDAQRCEIVLDTFNKESLQGRIDPAQLTEIVRSLATQRRLPSQFVTKKQARDAGWSPGRYFADIPQLRGKSIGGDRFGNIERRLPKGQWQEADLDYRGKKRNAKRLVFGAAGDRYVTVDHYETFHKVPACQ